MAQQEQTMQAEYDHPAGKSILSIDVTDFGPVTKGVLNLKPLTILIGPNGCGKSHIATLIHSVINAEYDAPVEMLNPNSDASFNINTLLEESIRIHKARMDGADSTDSNIYESYTRHKFQKLHDMLAANFAGGYKSLIRAGKECFKIILTSKDLSGVVDCADTIKSTPVNKTRLKIHFKRHRDFTNVDLDKLLRIDGDTVHMDIPDFHDRILFEASAVVPLLTAALHIRQPSLGRSIYFPAERGGLTLAYRSLTLHFYNNIGWPSANSLDLDMTNVSTNFLSLLLKHIGDKTKFADAVEIFEKKALNGNVVAHEDEKKSINVVFEQSGASFPLSKSASSVRDLALFLLYLKHRANEGETVILEEPETTMHPRNQILLARFIAKMVNAGLRVLITTHSQYFLEQISHCVMAGSSSGGGILPFQNDEMLNNDSVAAYRFKNDGDGYCMSPIEVDADGIPQYEFTDVSEGLYNELLRLERADDS